MKKEEVARFRKRLSDIKAMELANPEFLVEVMSLRNLISDLLSINIKMKKNFIIPERR